jgi:uncharacterized protein
MAPPEHNVTRARSMLISFGGENIRSFRDPFELSMLATRLSEKGVPRELEWRRDGRPISLLPAIGVFGANASGKSNLLWAMAEMRGLVLNSFRRGSPGGRLPTIPFALGEDEASLPSRFEIDLVLDGVRHEYGFVLDGERVHAEWARSYPRGRATILVEREGENLHLGGRLRAEGRATERILRPNALFLSTAAAAEHPLFMGLFEWFQRNLIAADVQTRAGRQALTTKLLEDEAMKGRILELLREADLGITGVQRRELDPDLREKLARVIDIFRGEDPDEDLEAFELDEFEVRLKHRGAREVELPLGQESYGTLVWFGLIGPVIEALQHGTVLLADEIEASLHPSLVAILVDLFQSQRSNPKGAQLIFNTHQVTLMGDSGVRPLGRDQIWFTERDDDGASRLVPLADQAPRRDEALARRYLSGRYGGMPILSRSRLEQIAEPVGPPED